MAGLEDPEYSFTEQLRELYYGVNWTEPWLIGLGAFHLITATSIVLLRDHHYIQAVILVVLGILCLLSEKINEYAAAHYQVFARQQYFDSAGWFISIVFAGPMIINSLLTVLLWFCGVWGLMTKLAVAKSRHQAHRRATEKDGKKTEAKKHK